MCIERFSFECLSYSHFLRFCINMFCHWFWKLATLFQPNGSRTKTNRGSLRRVCPRFAQAMCTTLQCVFASKFDWFAGLSLSFVIGQNGYFAWLWFYNAQLKTAINPVVIFPLLSLELYHEGQNTIIMMVWIGVLESSLIVKFFYDLSTNLYQISTYFLPNLRSQLLVSKLVISQLKRTVSPAVIS